MPSAYRKAGRQIGGVARRGAHALRDEHSVRRLYARAPLVAGDELAAPPPRRGPEVDHPFDIEARDRGVEQLELFGVNPWTLMRWMGHKRIDETMLYVNLADAHRRELPPNIVAAGARETDPDRRIVAMLGCRGTRVASGGRAKIQRVGIAEEIEVGVQDSET